LDVLLLFLVDYRNPTSNVSLDLFASEGYLKIMSPDDEPYHTKKELYMRKERHMKNGMWP
jgi:hypothetical protein